MGNKMVLSDVKFVEEKSIDLYVLFLFFFELLDVLYNVDNIIIDLDVFEYNEYFKYKWSFSRSEGNFNEFFYFKWMKMNNVGGF